MSAQLRCGFGTAQLAAQRWAFDRGATDCDLRNVRELHVLANARMAEALLSPEVAVCATDCRCPACVARRAAAFRRVRR